MKMQRYDANFWDWDGTHIGDKPFGFNKSWRLGGFGGSNILYDVHAINSQRYWSVARRIFSSRIIDR